MCLGDLITAYLYVGDFFVVNDGLLVDLMKPQVLQCIICKFEQTFNDVLAQRFTLCKGLIKYNMVNGIIPMNIHV